MERLRIASGRIAAAIVLLIVLTAPWCYGGENNTAQLYIAIATAAAWLLSGISPPHRSKTDTKPGCDLFMAIAVTLLLYGYVQTLDIGLGQSDPFTTNTRESLVGIIDTNRSATTAPMQSAETDTAISRLPRHSRLTLPIYAIAVALYCITGRLAPNRRQRAYLATAVIATGTMVAVWSFIQHSDNHDFILPGVRDAVAGIHLGPFYYKNAGAAFLLIPIALLACGFASGGFVWPWHDDVDDDRSIRPAKLGAPNLLAATALVAMFVATVLSSSRSAWFGLTVIVAVAMVHHWRQRSKIGLTEPPTDRRRRRTAVMMLAASGLIVASTLVVTVDRSGAIGRPLEFLRGDRLAADARWDHWRDSIHTAVQAMPWGTGTGTYRYAVLSDHRLGHSVWFRHAHNQYLEILIEWGLPGILGVACFIISAVVAIRRRAMARRSSPRNAAAIATTLLILILCFSVVDFVWIVPANLWTLAILAGCLGSIRTAPRTHPMRMSFGPLGTAAALCTAAALVCSVVDLRQDQMIDRILANTEPPRLAGADAKRLRRDVDATLDTLDRAVDAYPDSASLRRRRSSWSLVRFRLAAAQMIRCDLQGTDPGYLSAMLVGGHRQIESLRRHPDLLASMNDRVSAAMINPYVARDHYELARTAALRDETMDSSFERLLRLSRCDADMTFDAGRLALAMQRHDLALVAWQQSIASSLKHFDEIFALSQQHLPPILIARQLIPSTRLYHFNHLVAAEQTRSPDSATRLAGQLAADLRERPDRYVGASGQSTEALRARLWWLAGDYRNAAKDYSAALAADRYNANLRWHLAESLRLCGDLEDSLQQAVLARTMMPTDQRFVGLEKRIRAQMRTLY